MDKGDLPIWPEQRTDLRLKIAEHEAIQSGVITPLLKEELWTKIQHSRLERGLDELTVEVKVPIKTPLTNEEETKVASRREKNRQAAIRCRQKRKNKQKDLEVMLEKETETNIKLKALYQSLLNEKELLMAQLGLTPSSAPEVTSTSNPEVTTTSPPETEPARLWIPAVKAEPSGTSTSLPMELARVWTPISNPPEDESFMWNVAPTPTPPPPEDPSWQTLVSPKYWTLTTPEKDSHLWKQQASEEDLPSPPPPECFSYWPEDELQVVPGEGCSNLRL